MSAWEGMGPGVRTLGGGGRISSEPSGVGQSLAPEHAGGYGRSRPTRASLGLDFSLEARTPRSQTEVA